MPELNVTKALDHSEAKWYQSQVGVLHWMVKLGHLDIITEVSLLASHSALPREGHLDAMYHLYVHIKKKHNSRMVFDPTYPKIDVSSFLAGVQLEGLLWQYQRSHSSKCSRATRQGRWIPCCLLTRVMRMTS
jgi:hypothetical protein